MSASLVPMGGRGNAGLGGLVVTYFTNGEDELALLSWPVQPTALAPAIPRPTYTAAEREVLAFARGTEVDAASEPENISVKLGVVDQLFYRFHPEKIGD